jgi:hypothetical protein
MMKKLLAPALTACLWALAAAVFAAANVAKSPDTVKLDSIAKTYPPVVFSHGKHASLAGNCGTCHHHHSNSNCKDCHALSASAVSSNFPACKNCHAARDRGAPGMPGLEVAYHRTCFECHRGMGNLGVDPKGCNEVCHAPRQQKATRK